MDTLNTIDPAHRGSIDLAWRPKETKPEPLNHLAQLKEHQAQEHSRIGADSIGVSPKINPGNHSIDPAQMEFDRVKKYLPARIKKIKPRLGLVPNYLINRGEAISEAKPWHNPIASTRKVIEKILKLNKKKDFRDEQLHLSFEYMMETLSACKNKGLDNQIKTLLNQTNTNGDTLLHQLILTRQLKFLKSLLLNCSQWVDLNKLNSKGFSPLRLAKDRLEIEMYYLLRLYGAEDQNNNNRHSLGLIEWLRTDMFSNIDSGRWLNRAAIRAAMEFTQAQSLPSAALTWAHQQGELDDELLQALGNIPQLFSMTIADGCDAITNHEAWAGCIRLLLRQHQHAHPPLNQNNLILDIQPPPIVDTQDFEARLSTLGLTDCFDHVAGRTLFFQQQDSETKVGVKFSKSYEDEKACHPLIKEAKSNEIVRQIHQHYPLKSSYPKNIELINVYTIPKHYKSLINQQSALGYHAFDLSDQPDGTLVHLYESPEGYDQYIIDPSIPIERCIQGLTNAIYDYGVLARCGYFHSALVDIHHDATLEQRPHLWSFESFLTRFRSGAGRIDGGFSGLSAPNVRVSGLADLKHLLNQNEVNLRFDPSTLHSQHNNLYDEFEQHQIAHFEQLGSGLFAIALLAGACWEKRHSLGCPPSNNLNLSHTIQACFDAFLQGYLQVDTQRSEHLLACFGLNFDVMSNQIQTFATKEYARIAQTAPPRPLFGFGTHLLHTALPHLSQNEHRSSNAKGQLSQIQALYLDANANLPSSYPRIDTTMMRTSVQWKKEIGWVNKKGQSCFGPHQGTLPFQRLITDLFRMVGLSAMLFANEHSTSTPAAIANEEILDEASSETGSGIDPQHRIQDSVEVIMRPLDGLKVRKNKHGGFLTLKDRIKNIFYAPMHVFLVVGRQSSDPEVISAGLLKGRCQLANNQHPFYVTDHDKSTALSLEEDHPLKVKVKTLPVDSVELLQHAQNSVDQDQDKNVRTGGHRYGPKLLGFSHCHTRLSKEILRPVVRNKNKTESMRFQSDPSYLPHFIYSEELTLPSKNWDKGWKPI